MARKPRLEAFLNPRTRPSSKRPKVAPQDSVAIQAIWDVVAAIPHGEVWTYGAVARAAGLPGRARQAGRALRVAPKTMNLPWHRVLGAGGRIVFPKTSREYREQAERLRVEGVPVREGRVPAGRVQNGRDF